MALVKPTLQILLIGIQIEDFQNRILSLTKIYANMISCADFNQQLYLEIFFNITLNKVDFIGAKSFS